MEELDTINIEEVKTEIKETVKKIKAEANTLLKNLDKILEDIDSVTTVEEAVEFDKNHQKNLIEKWTSLCRCDKMNPYGKSYFYNK